MGLHEHAALTAVISRFGACGAVRAVGKVLDLPEDTTAALAKQVWGWPTEIVVAAIAVAASRRARPEV